MQIAGAVGIAVMRWSVLPANVTVLGAVVGAAGTGVVTGKFYLPSVPLPVSSSLAAAGVLGALSPQVATAVGVGIGNAYTASAGYRGASVGAVGAEVSKVSFANPATLVQGLIQSFAAFQIRGPTAGTLAMGLGSGIAAMFLTGTGTGFATGAAGPTPGTGISRSSLL